MKRYVLMSLLIIYLSFTGCNSKSSEVTEIKSITLAVFESHSQLSRSRLSYWVDMYNEKNSDVKIEIVNYLDNYYDANEALNQIKMEIIAGKGPDMINFGNSYSPLDASSGMLIDLYPLIKSDGLYNKQDFFINVLDSFAIDEKLYVLVPSYRIVSFSTVDNKLSGLESMDISQLMDAYMKRDDGGILFPGETKTDVFAMICYRNMRNYVDWNKGICYFNEDSFKRLLYFANQFPMQLIIPNEYSVKPFFAEGRALLYPITIDNVYKIAGIRMLYGETPTYIGYPIDNGNGNMAGIINIAIGISSTSKNKEEAWGFLRSLLGSDFQDYIKSGLPLRVSSLEQKLMIAMKEEHEANGEKAIKEQLIFDGDEPVNIYKISNEDANTLNSIINKIEFSATVDSILYSIILEEAVYLFNDNRNIDDVANIIQNRASLYINENR